MPTSAALDVVAKKLKLKFFEVRPILFYFIFVIFKCNLDATVKMRFITAEYNVVWKLANWTVILLVDPMLNDFGRFF